MSSPTADKRRTVPQIRSQKKRSGDEPIVMITAYDTPSAQIACAAGVDIILVGDSVGNVVLGYEDTLHVSMDDMVHHTSAVARANPTALLVADMPWLSYHTGKKDAVQNAAALIRAGADAVKLEGGSQRKSVIEALCHAEIPVMGHLGLTPQSVLRMGGYKVQAKDLDSAKQLIDEAHVLCDAGVFSMVLEGVPDVVAARVTDSVDVPTIGIGAGKTCDGQVLVFHDLLGLSNRQSPKFVRRYADLADIARVAIEEYAKDVKEGRFPADNETYHASKDLNDSLG